MSNVSLLAKLTTHDGKGDELVAAFEELFAQVENEPGTLLYAMNRAKDDPNVFWFYELYTDGDALGAHSQSDAMKRVGGQFGALLKDVEMIVGTPVRAKGFAVS